MGLTLPGSGDSAGTKIIVPGGRRAAFKGQTRRFYLADPELLYLLKTSQSQDYLRHHRDHLHIVGCSNTGMFACLHCSRRVYDMQSKEDQQHFIAEHVNCRPTKEGDAVGELVIEE